MPPKSGHNRAKNIAYDDDDGYSDDDGYYEGEEGGDEMADEDREQMRICTIQVKEALGSSVTVSEAQIQEALWHYYFDVGKSVTYLKNKFAPEQTTSGVAAKQQSKAPSRFDQASKAAKVQATSATDYPCLYPVPPVIDFMDSMPHPFCDVPWNNIPSNRLGIITTHPLLPRGRLLGGSSKPSKLAALAAARKKKQEQSKTTGTPTSTMSPDAEVGTDKAVALLDRLSVRDNKGITNASLRGGEGEERKSTLGRYPPRKRARTPPPVETKPEESTTPEPEPAIEMPNLRAGPSMFASVLCGTITSTSSGRKGDLESFVLPYSRLPEYRDSNPFGKPSPDDVVLRAQAKGTKSTAETTKKASGDKLAGSVEKLVVEDTPRVKSKNLNVLEEFERSGMKQMANFVVIGHVDHGKSTLMGRLLYDLKVIDQRSVDKLHKEAETIGKSSFALAWVMDQTSEERSRGVTVDIATNYFETDTTRFTILDAPGHKDFIPNMIAGASQADFAVLVIDASVNSFESGLKGQTKEHALLVRSMGVQRLIVAVNKMDTVSWSQERFEEISQQMTAFLTAASFSPKSITFVPCAGLTGENVIKQVKDPNASWYHGETLVKALESSEPAKRRIEGALRLTVGDVFRGGIQNPLSISGRIDAGSVQIGDVVLAMPSNETAVVKSIEVENEPVDWAVAGQIPTLHLTDIDPVHLRLGDILCDPKSPVKLIKSFAAKILAFGHVMPMSVDVFRGRLQAEGKITQLVALLEKAKGDVLKKKPRIVKPGEVARVVVELERELPLEVGIRVVLREGGDTVAAGLIEG